MPACQSGMNKAPSSARSAEAVIPPGMGFAYALPVVPLLLLMHSLNVVQGIYAEHYGLALTTISAVMFFAGLFDAVTDLAIGHWSDRVKRRTGNRRVFVAVGAAAAVPCAWFLFVPDGHVGVAYFMFWYIAFYLSVTLFMIPHFALGGELSSNSAERTKAYGFRTLGTYAGITLYYLIPLTPFFTTGEITPETMRTSILASAVLMVPCLLIFLKRVPPGVADSAQPRSGEAPWSVLMALSSNRPLLIYLLAFLMFSLGMGVFYGLMFIVIDSWLDLGGYFPQLMLFHLAVATLMLRPAIWLSNRIGKRRTWAVAAGLQVCCLPFVLLLLGGGSGSLGLLFVLQFFLGASSSMGNVSTPSLFMDVIDYDRLKSGHDRTATFFSLRSFLEKVSTTTIGFPLGGAIIGLYGYDPAQPEWTERALFGFSLAMGWLPTIIAAAAVGLIFLIPLNQRRRAIIRRRLDRRDKRMSPAAAQGLGDHSANAMNPAEPRHA